jgi:hypothetical protein
MGRTALICASAGDFFVGTEQSSHGIGRLSCFEQACRQRAL